MNSVEVVSRALNTPHFLMSSPASLQGFEPEQYREKAACRRAWDSLRSTLSQLGAEVDVCDRTTPNSPAVSEVGNAAFIHNDTAFIPKQKCLRGIIRRQFMDEWLKKEDYALNTLLE